MTICDQLQALTAYKKDNLAAEEANVAKTLNVDKEYAEDKKSVFSKEINTSRVQKDGIAVEYEEVAGNANWDTTKNRQNVETIT